MEKRCEFCTALSPIVYCKADTAHLCLSCDAKVHSANALSYRHPRTLVCESCRHQPASVRCLDHVMYMCRNCDVTSHHRVSFQHQKRAVSCYVGCPSAKELAVLWGFELNGLENNDNNGIEVGSSSRGNKVVKDNNWQQNSHLILQQIHDLERLQLSEDVIDDSRSAHIKERTGGLPFKHDTLRKFHTNLNIQTDHLGSNLDFQQTSSQLEADNMTEEPLSSPFSQLDNFTSSANPLHGDSFWQYKSPAHNNEIWLQNMQDLGVCDEVQCFDDVNIPDVDLTFRNFEELFGSEHEPNRALVDDEDMSCSFADKHSSFGKLDRGCATISFGKLDRGCATIIEDISGPSPVCPNAGDKEIYTSDQVHQLQTNDYPPRPIRPCYSASSSFSFSRNTGESSGSEYKDDGLSPTFPKQILPNVSYDTQNTKLDAKENVIMRHKEKKVLWHEKQAQYTSPKSKSGGKKQGKTRALKFEGYEDQSTNVTRSF